MTGGPDLDPPAAPVWGAVVAATVDECLTQARSAVVCCDAHHEDDLGDVKDELTQAIQHLEIAQRFADDAAAAQPKETP